jgi:hypothetical protein
VPDPAGLAADITNPQTWNRYGYVGNSPLSNVDPLGLYANDPPPVTWLPTGTLFGGFVGGGALNPLRFQLLPLDGSGEGRGVDLSQEPADDATDPNRPVLRHHDDCGAALEVTGKTMASVARAFAR